MKKLMQFVLEWKTSASLFFTASVSVYLLFSLWKGFQQTPVATLWGLLFMSLAGSLFQTLCFSNWVFKKLRYTWRSLLFILLFLPALALIAWKTRWFPASRPEAWVGKARRPCSVLAFTSNKHLCPQPGRPDRGRKGE